MKATPAYSREPLMASSPTRAISSIGMLSMTNHPMSSRAAETVERPAPDIPATSKTSLIVAPLGRLGLGWRLQMIVEPSRHVTRQPGEGLEFTERGLTQRVEGAEGREQALAARRTES